MSEAYQTKAEYIISSSVGSLLKMTVDDATEGRCVVRMPVSDAAINGAGRVHGGAITSLIDNAATAAAWAYKGLGKDARGTTISLTCNFMDAVKGDAVIADAQVTRRGRGTVFLEVHVADSNGTSVAQGVVIYKMNPGKP